MKTLLTLLCSLGFVAQGPAQPSTAGSTPAEAETPVEAPKKAAPKAPVRISPPVATTEKALAKKAEAAKKAESGKKEEPKIKGVVVPRGERGFLGVEMVEGTFKIAFYDAKKKPVEPDVTRAALRWDPKYKVGQERLVLNLDADGKSLSSPRIIRPPYNFKLFITLIKEATAKEEPVGETHVIDFRD